jgi:hypothetical protein
VQKEEMNTIKIDGFLFQVANSGLEITIEGNRHRFDPTQSMKLLNYLDEHRGDIQKAVSLEPAEPAIHSPEWYHQKENEAFNSIPE